MTHLPLPEQPAFIPDTENEVYALEWVARDILGHNGLWQTLKSHRKKVVDTKAEASDLSFQKDDAIFLLNGLRHVVNTFPQSNPRREMAQAMLDEYEAMSNPAPQIIA